MHLVNFQHENIADIVIFSFVVILFEESATAYLCCVCLHVCVVARSGEGIRNFTQIPLRVKTLAELVS
jgi:hypothetical protein